MAAGSAEGRLGVLGGTFDPIHVGHQIVAQDALEALDLERLLVVPAARPPHRDPVLEARSRLRITRRAFEDDPRIEVSELELERSGPSFTVDTLEELDERRPDAPLFCIVGADQFREFAGWRRPRRIAELATLAVMNRAGEEPEPPPELPDLPFTSVPVTRIELSSTRVRERLADRRSVRYLVPEAVRSEVEAAYRPRTVRT